MAASRTRGARRETLIAELRRKFAGDVEASAMLDQLAEGTEIRRRHAGFRAYEFFVARRPLAQTQPEAINALAPGAPMDGLTPAAEL